MRGGRGDREIVPIPGSARILDPLLYARHGFALTDTVLAIRGGWLTRRFSLIPLSRIQSVSLHQGPLQRFRRVASVRAAGPRSGPLYRRARRGIPLPSPVLTAVCRFKGQSRGRAARALAYPRGGGHRRDLEGRGERQIADGSATMGAWIPPGASA